MAGPAHARHRCPPEARSSNSASPLPELGEQSGTHDFADPANARKVVGRVTPQGGEIAILGRCHTGQQLQALRGQHGRGVDPAIDEAQHPRGVVDEGERIAVGSGEHALPSGRRRCPGRGCQDIIGLEPDRDDHGQAHPGEQIRCIGELIDQGVGLVGALSLVGRPALTSDRGIRIIETDHHRIRTGAIGGGDELFEQPPDSPTRPTRPRPETRARAGMETAVEHRVPVQGEERLHPAQHRTPG